MASVPRMDQIQLFENFIRQITQKHRDEDPLTLALRLLGPPRNTSSRLTATKTTPLSLALLAAAMIDGASSDAGTDAGTGASAASISYGGDVASCVSS